MTSHIKHLVLSAIAMSSLSLVSAPCWADLGQLYRDAEKLSNQEKVSQASLLLKSMQDVLTFTLKELQSSYDQKDFEWTNCIKRELSTVKGLIRISEEAEVNLNEASVTGQVQIVNTEFVKIKMATERIRDLRSKIGSCSKEVNDPLFNQKQNTNTPEISDKSVQAFTPTSDENMIILYEPIASERPEAISPSE